MQKDELFHVVTKPALPFRRPNFPAKENTLSLGTAVAGIARYLKKTWPDWGTLRSLVQSSTRQHGSLSSLGNASSEYAPISHSDEGSFLFSAWLFARSLKTSQTSHEGCADCLGSCFLVSELVVSTVGHAARSWSTRSLNHITWCFFFFQYCGLETWVPKHGQACFLVLCLQRASCFDGISQFSREFTYATDDAETVNHTKNNWYLSREWRISFCVHCQSQYHRMASVVRRIQRPPSILMSLGHQCCCSMWVAQPWLLPSIKSKRRASIKYWLFHLVSTSCTRRRGFLAFLSWYSSRGLCADELCL